VIILNQKEIKDIMEKESEMPFLGTYRRYLYGKEIGNWNRRNKGKIHTSDIEIPRWLKGG